MNSFHSLLCVVLCVYSCLPEKPQFIESFWKAAEVNVIILALLHRPSRSTY